jgi:hypothetical protein
MRVKKIKVNAVRPLSTAKWTIWPILTNQDLSRGIKFTEYTSGYAFPLSGNFRGYNFLTRRLKICETTPWGDPIGTYCSFRNHYYEWIDNKYEN